MPFSDNLAKPNHCQRLIFRVKRELKLIESLHTTCKTRIFFLDSSIFVFVRKPRNSFANQEKPRNSNARYPLRHRLPPRLALFCGVNKAVIHPPRSWHPLGESREIRMRRGVLGAERQISHDDLHVPLGSLRFEDKIQRLEFFNFFSRSQTKKSIRKPPSRISREKYTRSPCYSPALQWRRFIHSKTVRQMIQTAAALNQKRRRRLRYKT